MNEINFRHYFFFEEQKIVRNILGLNFLDFNEEMTNWTGKHWNSNWFSKITSNRRVFNFLANSSMIPWYLMMKDNF